MNQLSQQIQHPTKRKRRCPNKRDGRSFWQPDGTKEVREVTPEAWSGLWQASSPVQTISVWRNAMKSQKQAVLQSQRPPLNGHRYPSKKKTPPRQPDSATLLTGRPTPSTTFTVEVHQASQSVAKMALGRPLTPFSTGFELNHTPKPPTLRRHPEL